jgi:lysine 6-dehydrogenase
MTQTLVIGAGIVGRAAVWDLVRRGHHVTVADADETSARRVAAEMGATAATADVTDAAALEGLISGHDVVISAVPYRFGLTVATAAIAARAHYLDFGGNPGIVAAQRDLDGAARAAGVAVVPDCGLAPGLANVLAEDLIAETTGPIGSVQLRVGALPQQPRGALGYQLAFNPAGLINEYAEPCEIIENGRYTTVEPLTNFEDVPWEGWGPLEAFSTAGGTSSLCLRHAGRVQHLEYKTLRFPGHGASFRALLEIGLFDESATNYDGCSVAPRTVLLAALARGLPSGEPDLVLVRVWSETDGVRQTLEIEDVHDERFSALARTTAFPATALADLLVRGTVIATGVHTMHEAVSGRELLPELEPVGIVTVSR